MEQRVKRWKPVPTWWCRIWGHSWDPEGAEYYCVYHCVRCLHEGYTDGSIRERISLRLWIWRNRLRDWVRPVRRWIRCEYCHLWFGRHDERDDHIPF